MKPCPRLIDDAARRDRPSPAGGRVGSWWTLPILIWPLLAMGCGDDRGLVPVKGIVTMNGQAMPGPGDLTFVPVETPAGIPRRPAKAEFAVDGKFAAQSFQPGDGLYPGTYKVGVACWKVAPTPDGPPAESHIATKFNSPMTSGLEVEVPAGQRSVVVDFDVQPN